MIRSATARPAIDWPRYFHRSSLRLAAALLLLSPTFRFCSWVRNMARQPFSIFRQPRRRSAGCRGPRRTACRVCHLPTERSPDAADPATFERSKLDWTRAAQNGDAKILALIPGLLSMRSEEPMLRPDGATTVVPTAIPDGSPSCASRRSTITRPGAYAGDSIVSLFNCSDQSVDVQCRVRRPRMESASIHRRGRLRRRGSHHELRRSVARARRSEAPSRSAARQAVRVPAWSAATFSSV